MLSSIGTICVTHYESRPNKMSARFAQGRRTAENPGKLRPAGSHNWTGSRMPITLPTLSHVHTGWQRGSG
jgi:hypothetical protein